METVHSYHLTSQSWLTQVVSKQEFVSCCACSSISSLAHQKHVDRITSKVLSMGSNSSMVCCFRPYWIARFIPIFQNFTYFENLEPFSSVRATAVDGFGHCRDICTQVFERERGAKASLGKPLISLQWLSKKEANVLNADAIACKAYYVLDVNPVLVSSLRPSPLGR